MILLTWNWNFPHQVLCHFSALKQSGIWFQTLKCFETQHKMILGKHFVLIWKVTSLICRTNTFKISLSNHEPVRENISPPLHVFMIHTGTQRKRPQGIFVLFRPLACIFFLDVILIIFTVPGACAWYLIQMDSKMLQVLSASLNCAVISHL